MSYGKRNNSGPIDPIKHPYPYHYIPMDHDIYGQRRKAGNAIRRYRKMMDYSRRELAAIVAPYAAQYNTKFTVSDISAYEDRLVSPKIDKLTALCHATQLPASFFTGYTDIVVTKVRKPREKKAA